MPPASLLGRPIEAFLPVADLAIALYDASPEHRCLQHNERLLELVGRTPGDSLVGRPLREVVGEAAYPGLKLLFDQVLASGRPEHVDEFPMLLPGDPEPRYFQWSLAPLLDDGRVDAVVVSGVEVTELVRAREAVRASEAQLRLALDAVRMAVWTWDVRDDVFEWSEPAAALLGIPAGRRIGSLASFLGLIHAADRQRVQRAVEAGLADGRQLQVEFRVVGPRAAVHWLEARGQVQRNGDGLPERMVGVAVDVTARRRAEEQQRALTDASRRFAEAQLDERKLIEALCEAAVRALGDWAQIQLLDENGDPLGPPVLCDPVGAQTGRARRVTGGRALVVPLRVHDWAIGSLAMGRRITRPPYSDDEVALAQALGDRAAVAIENARLYLKAQEAVGTRDRSLSVVVHELRTPVTAIKGYAQSLRRSQQRGTLDAEALDRATAILIDASDRLVRLTQDLIDVGRITGGELEVQLAEVDLVAFVRDAAEQQRPTIVGAHDLVVELPSEPLIVRADRARLAQVLGNLLDNAVKYSPSGGTIRLGVTADEHGATVSVSDDGIGLPAGVAGTIFEAFGRASNARTVGVAGMGLGLHVSRAIVERHGGRIWAESDGEGKGTTVSVWLPLASSNERGEAPA